MQFSATRRTGKTYGKASRNVVHDLFDHRGPRNVTSSTAIRDTVSAPVSMKDAKHDSQAATSNATSKPTGDNASPSTASRFSTAKRSTNEDNGLFDMQSSDDGMSTDTSGSRSSKRRRTDKSVLVPRTSNQKASSKLAATPQKVQSDLGKFTAATDKAPPVVKSATAMKRPTTTTSTKILPSTKPKAHQPPTILSEKPTSKPLSHMVKSKKVAPPVPKEDVVMVDQPSFEVAEDRPARLPRTTALATITPKRKRPSPAMTDSDGSSPGRLGLSELKLTPKAISPSPSSPDLSSDGSAVLKKGRRRLIDRLDAPSHSQNHTSGEQTSDDLSSRAANRTPKPARISSKALQNKTKPHIQKPNIVLEGSDKSQPKAGWPARPRATYATQRSHLSDMVDDLDMLSAPSSQNSTGQLFLPTSKSNLASQLDLESEDSDDVAGVSKLKSIHELRQAGAVTRYDRELDALLEDIVVSEQSSKALRLQALMKLANRLHESDFLRHLVSIGRVQRLTATAIQVKDLPSSILLGHALKILSASENVTADMIVHLTKAGISLAPSMLVDDRSLSKIAKDRKENLSKAIVRDLIEFEKSMEHENKEQELQTYRLCADIVALKLLEHTLRKTIQLGNTSAAISTPLYSQILQILCLQAQPPETLQRDVSVYAKLEVALSLVELCSVVVDDSDLHTTDDEYTKLGDALATIIYQTDRRPLEQGVLRVVVSLSNNKPRLCRLFGATQISKVVFGIINDNFLKLARQAENEDIMDESKLDSVLLALGCLLNFAESDSTLRTRLAEMRPDNDHPIHQLVTIFNSQVSKVDEAMTKEQGQISVAFGYLSMLLCALSLHPLIKGQITQLLKHKSFNELCAAARKFFSHLRTLEHITDDNDASMSTFIARFEAILVTIQGSNTEGISV